MIYKLLLTCTFIILTISTLSSCLSKKNEGDLKTLRLSFLSEPNSLDPRFGYEIPANHVVKMLFEPLMRHTPQGELIPAGAESYEILENGKKYIFHLREARWSNGDKVTAFDYEYSWKSVIDPDLPTQGGSDFYAIKNVSSIISKALPLEAAGIKAIDEKTLEVELEYPTPYFLELIATSAFSPVHRRLAKEGKETWFVSNGPFVLKKWRPQDSLELDRNSLYWNSTQVRIDKIQISIIEDAMTQLSLFEKNEFDWFGKPFSKLPLDAVLSLKERELLSFFPERAVYWYFINTEKFPFTNAKMRKAFSYAIDREQICLHLLKEGEQPARGINCGNSFFEDNQVAAVQLFNEALEELGLEKKDCPTISLSYCNIETNKRIALIIQEQLKNIFSVEIRLDPQEWTAYYDNLSNSNFQLGGLSWHSRIQDPLYNLQLFQNKVDRLNMSNWESPHFQRLLTKIQNSSAADERADWIYQAEALLMEEMPVIPIYFLMISYAKNPHLKGVYLSDINEIDFTYAYFDQ